MESLYKIFPVPDDGSLIHAVRKIDWKRGLPGGWLEYSPHRRVAAYGDGSLYTDKGQRYKDLVRWKLTAWSGSVPFSDTTVVTKAKAIPNRLVKTGIIEFLREKMRECNIEVSDITGTGIWCNYYDERGDYISEHTDDENYYQQPPYFASLTLYEDEQPGEENLAHFQIKEKEKWIDVPLYHASLLIMSGGVPHRVKPQKAKDIFRKRYNITFRTPISQHVDLVKNYRFFSNFGRYYRKTYLIFVPKTVFLDKKHIPKENSGMKYDREKNIAVDHEDGEIYSIKDSGNAYNVLQAHSKFGPVRLMLNLDITKQRRTEMIGKNSRPPATTTDMALVLMRNSE